VLCAERLDHFLATLEDKVGKLIAMRQWQDN
jgi:hypothetical protein